MSPDRKKKPAAKPAALGRGLAALLGDEDLTGPTPPTDPRPGERVVDLPIERVEPNPFQPRRVYDQKALSALAASITEHGVLQPVVVRPSSQGYQLIAGERRLRATQLAGLTEIPAVVRQASDEQALLLALLENLQREDLGPLEEARAYQRLSEDFSLNQEEISRGVGKERSTVANSMRLLKLPTDIQNDLESYRLSAGHGRALLSLDSPELMQKARDQVLAKKLSVRATEALVKKMSAPPKPPAPPEPHQAYIQSLAEKIGRDLGAKVEIKRKGKAGSITIEFYSDEDLERLMALLQKP